MNYRTARPATRRSAAGAFVLFAVMLGPAGASPAQLASSNLDIRRSKTTGLASFVTRRGGGTIPVPGEVSLAHRGVLFLDELPEFKKAALEALRQPLEDGEVVIARVSTTTRFPARFLFAAAMNPCPCGFLGDSTRNCICNHAQIRSYRSRISGPLLDRIDLHVPVPAVKPEELTLKEEGEPSADIRKRVTAARARQLARFADAGIFSNGEMTPKHLRELAGITPEAEKALQQAIRQLGLSARAHHRAFKVGRTIADLAGRDKVTDIDVLEAVGFRELDRERLD